LPSAKFPGVLCRPLLKKPGKTGVGNVADPPPNKRARAYVPWPAFQPTENLPHKENAMTITVKQARAWLPPVKDMVGNEELRKHFADCIEVGPPEQDPSLLVYGVPGSGKSASIISYLRERLNYPQLGYGEEDAGLFALIKGNRYGWLRIDGSIITKEQLAAKVSDAIYCEGTFVFIDEIGELYTRRLDAALRPLLDFPSAVVYATAQRFVRKMRHGTVTLANTEDLSALWRRFPCRIQTQLPDENALVGYLKKLMETHWELGYDSEETIRLLAKKVGCVPGKAINFLVRQLARPKPYLRREDVERFPPE
jgi:hypothetical protein